MSIQRRFTTLFPPLVRDGQHLGVEQHDIFPQTILGHLPTIVIERIFSAHEESRHERAHGLQKVEFAAQQDHLGSQTGEDDAVDDAL